MVEQGYVFILLHIGNCDVYAIANMVRESRHVCIFSELTCTHEKILVLIATRGNCVKTNRCIEIIHAWT